MDKLKIYVCGHNEKVLENIADQPFLRKVNLNTLPIGKYQNNLLSESRIYLSNIIEPSEYIGFASYSWGSRTAELPRLRKLNMLDLQPNVVHYARTVKKDWGFTVNMWHRGIDKYINEIASVFSLNMSNCPAPLGNSFICSWEVFQKFHSEWLKIFHYLYEKYPPEKLDFDIGEQDWSRHAGYLYEYITVFVFANMSGVEFKQAAVKPRKLNLPLRLF